MAAGSSADARFPPLPRGAISRLSGPCLTGARTPNQRPFSPAWLLFWWVSWTPLMAGAGGGHTEVVDLLLQRGAKPDERSYWRRGSQSAASIAAKHGHLEVADLLNRRRNRPA